MINVFCKIRDLLDARERRYALALFAMMLIMGLLEALGVASIMPFIAVVSNPGIVRTNAYLSAAYESFGFKSVEDFLLLLGIAVFGLVIGSLAFKAATQWVIARYSHMRNYSISSRLLRAYLARPYSWFLNRHSADLGKAILSEVGQVIGQVLVPGMQLIAHAIVVICLVGLVITIEPKVAFVAIVVLGAAYGLIYVMLRKYLSWIGADRVRANEQRFQVAQEALGGIKDVKVLGLEDAYIRIFRPPASRFARHQAASQIIAQVPRYVFEGLGFGGLIVIILLLLTTSEGDLSGVMPLVALYAFAGYRLIPALQQVYQALTQIRYGKPALDALHADLSGIDLDENAPKETLLRDRLEIVPLREKLELRTVSYQYPEADRAALADLNLEIPANTTVALVGSTGAGKTTVADIILGLLRPQQGKLWIDGVPLDDSRVRAWQRNIGYVPQHIFLTDDTVAANIAFGVPPERVNPAAIERAARIAKLHDFVADELPAGYQTMVGERGVRLSGGQRQRIGIARALYHDPDVLVLDEATSALDSLTEKAVMDAVQNLAHKKTIILIAHRISTVRQCDIIFLLEGGKVLARGAYDDLIEKNTFFRELAGSTHPASYSAS